MIILWSSEFHLRAQKLSQEKIIFAYCVKRAGAKGDVSFTCTDEKMHQRSKGLETKVLLLPERHQSARDDANWLSAQIGSLSRLHPPPNSTRTTWHMAPTLKSQPSRDATPRRHFVSAHGGHSAVLKKQIEHFRLKNKLAFELEKSGYKTIFLNDIFINWNSLSLNNFLSYVYSKVSFGQMLRPIPFS